VLTFCWLSGLWTMNGIVFGVMYGSDDEEEVVKKTDVGPHVQSSDLSDKDLRKSTRLPRALFNQVLTLLRPKLERDTLRSEALTADTTLLIACTFFATGGEQWLVGRTGHTSQSTVSRCVELVVSALCEIAPQFIKLPLTEEERILAKQEFYNSAGFPGILGSVDGTHVSITKPGGNSIQYINRKCCASVNMQVTCSQNLKVIDVVADYPGANHDSYIWKKCSLREAFASGLIPEIDAYCEAESKAQIVRSCSIMLGPI
jgi:DDE superfamily endonuclease